MIQYNYCTVYMNMWMEYVLLSYNTTVALRNMDKCKLCHLLVVEYRKMCLKKPFLHVLRSQTQMIQMHQGSLSIIGWRQGLMVQGGNEK